MGGEGALLPGHRAACRPQPRATSGPPWPPASPPRDCLGWGPAALWGALLRALERTTESPPHPHLPSTVQLWNRGRPRGSEASVDPTAPARKGGPSWGPDASCPGPAHISHLTCSGRGPDTITSSKAVGISQSGALGLPVWVQSPAPPLPGATDSVTQLHCLYRGDRHPQGHREGQ